MNTKIETRPITIHERIARCLVEEVLRGRKSNEEVLRGKLTGSFRFIPTSADAAFLANDHALLKEEMKIRVNDLLTNQKRPRYKSSLINVRQIKNTIGLAPVAGIRLEITLTVTLLLEKPDPEADK